MGELASLTPFLATAPGSDAVQATYVPLTGNQATWACLRGSTLTGSPSQARACAAWRAPKPRHSLWPAVSLIVTQPADTRGSARPECFDAESPHWRDR